MTATVTLASVFNDQWSGIQHASLGNQLVDAAILLAVASALRMAENKTDLIFFKYLWWVVGGAGCFVIYHALFT